VNVVINFDFPKNSETYLHRVCSSSALELHYCLKVEYRACGNFMDEYCWMCLSCPWEVSEGFQRPGRNLVLLLMWFFLIRVTGRPFRKVWPSWIGSESDHLWRPFQPVIALTYLDQLYILKLLWVPVIAWEVLAAYVTGFSVQCLTTHKLLESVQSRVINECLSMWRLMNFEMLLSLSRLCCFSLQVLSSCA
jgi:hypothetical protein